MKYLVAGGRGFIGSYVTRDLIRRGESVVLLDTTTNKLVDSLLTSEEAKRVEFISGDASSFTEMARIVVEHKIDVLVHLVSMLSPYSDQNPPLAERINNVSFVNALEAARLWNLRLVWSSSVVVYGPRQQHPPGPVANDAPHHPASVYAMCKSYNEFLAQHYFRTWKVDHIGLRLTLVYGPGRTHGASAFVQRLLDDVALGRPAVAAFCDDELDWQYVEDISRLIITCAETKSPKTRIFNTRCDVRRMREAGAYIQSLVPDAEITYEPGEFGIAWELDDTALRNEIGFQWQHDMESGILTTINTTRSRSGLAQIAAPASREAGHA